MIFAKILIERLPKCQASFNVKKHPLVVLYKKYRSTVLSEKETESVFR